MSGVDTAESVARGIGGLSVVLGLIWIAVRLLRARVGGAGPSQLRVVQRVALGKRSGVALVRVADRCILVGVGDASITFLAEVASQPEIGHDRTGPALGLGRTVATSPPTAAPSRPSSAVPLQRSSPRGLRGVLARAQDRTVRR